MLLFWYSLLGTLSLVLYFQGFFPMQNTNTKLLNSSYIYETLKLNSNFDKFVFIIVDSMRHDFVTPELMPKSCNLYKKSGCLSQLKAEAPTVTLPRIKALTTGKVPQFIDILVNLANPEKLDTSLLHTAKNAGKKIVFYGDETWLKVFPDIFIRSEGTLTFFINDFYEVDYNVTRNLDKELKNNDWDVLILHYLGLDHIGHVHGSKSALIGPKLSEMDDVIAKIYETYQDKQNKPIILVTSDHGMRDGGGHGGSTPAEVLVPLIALGMDCENSKFAQIDLTANLAVLLGVDIPESSIGQLQSNILKSLDFDDYLKALKYNTWRLNRKQKNLCDNNLVLADYLYDLFLDNKNDVNLGKKAADLYQNCSRVISEKLAVLSAKQNIYSLVISIEVTLTILIKVCSIVFHNYIENNTNIVLFENCWMGFALMIQLCFNEQPNFSLSLIIFQTVLLLKSFLKFLQLYQFGETVSNIFLLTLLQPILFFTTSYLVEEHLFWYFFSVTFLLHYLLTNECKTNTLIMIFGLYFVTNLNRIGEKWVSSSDLSSWLKRTENLLFMHLIFLTSTVMIIFLLYKKIKMSKFKIVANFTILVLIYFFKLHCKEDIIFGKILWLIIFAQLIYCLFTKNSILSTWILIIALLLKPYNLILIPANIFASLYLKSSIKNSKNLVIAHWWFSTVLFFAQGHDNSLASVDISSGYIGVENYQPIPVFLQVLCHTFAMPILSHILLFNNNALTRIRNDFMLIFLLRINVVFFVSAVIFVHRHHPFIWMIFAPKIFIEGSNLGILLIQICFYYSFSYLNKIF